MVQSTLAIREQSSIWHVILHSLEVLSHQWYVHTQTHTNAALRFIQMSERILLIKYFIWILLSDVFISWSSDIATDIHFTLAREFLFIYSFLQQTFVLCILCTGLPGESKDAILLVFLSFCCSTTKLRGEKSSE